MKLYPEIAKERSIEAINQDKFFSDCREDTFHFEFEYPRSEGRVKFIEVGLSDVRASDGIRIRYDFERDGYTIEQPFFTSKDMGSYSQQVINWKETAFLQSWGLNELSDEDFKS